MTRDPDSVLRDADPARGAAPDDALLTRLRERVDAERTDVVPAGHRRSPWPRRLTLVAAAAAVLTAVPLVISAVGDGDGRSGRSLVPPAIAADGSISCVSGYTAAVPPEDAAVRLLPDRLPDGWAYTAIRARQDDPAACGPPSLTALREDPTGLVTGRIAVTGPIDARVRQGKLTRSVPDTLFGHPAHRFDGTSPDGVEHHRWVWTDDQGQWSAEASGMPLGEAVQLLAAVSIDGPQVGWDAAAAPGWSLVHLRDGAPYGVVTGTYRWSADLTDGGEQRFLEVSVSRSPAVPLLAGVGVGERVVTLAGRPAVLGHPRGGESNGGPPGSVATTPVLVELAPGTVAWSFGTDEQLPAVEEMLGSLRQVPADDPRIERYDTD